MKIMNVKGGYDFLPREQKIRNYINDTLREVFEEYGYLPIETSILCYFDMLAGKYDENNDILNEIYKLTDQGNRKLGLRYDLTVPFAKFIALNKKDIKLPFKRYEINKVFRDGPVKVGRDREFTQCDVDVVGLDGQMIEAELLNLYVRGYSKLNIDIVIKYNSRKLMSGLIQEAGVNEEDISSVITILDKIKKISREEIIRYLSEIGLSMGVIVLLLEYFTLSLDEINNKFKFSTNSLVIEGLNEINELEKYIIGMGIEKYCLFDSSLARGQDYYTGNVFEVYEKNGLLTSSIGGGGRYDKMIGEFIDDGEVYPAVGVSFGLTSLFELLKNREEFSNKSMLDIYIIPINTKVESLILGEKLRDLGFRVDIEMENKKIRKSLDFANKELIPYVIIYGEDEVKNGIFKLKDMFKNTEYEIKYDKIDEVIDILKSIS